MHSRTAIDRLIARRDIALREKALGRMLYETCARTDELLHINIEEAADTGSPRRDIGRVVGSIPVSARCWAPIRSVRMC